MPTNGLRNYNEGNDKELNKDDLKEKACKEKEKKLIKVSSKKLRNNK